MWIRTNLFGYRFEYCRFQQLQTKVKRSCKPVVRTLVLRFLIAPLMQGVAENLRDLKHLLLFCQNSNFKTWFAISVQPKTTEYCHPIIIFQFESRRAGYR